MDIETRVRRAAPPPVTPGAELQARVLAQVLSSNPRPQMADWTALLQGFTHYLIRYPIPVLTTGWLFWLLCSRLTTPFGTDIWLAQYVYELIVWR